MTVFTMEERTNAIENAMKTDLEIDLQREMGIYLSVEKISDKRFKVIDWSSEGVHNRANTLSIINDTIDRVNKIIEEDKEVMILGEFLVDNALGIPMGKGFRETISIKYSELQKVKDKEIKVIKFFETC